MVHQYVHEDRTTGLEMKYNEYKSRINSNNVSDNQELFQTNLKFLEEKKENKLEANTKLLLLFSSQNNKTRNHNNKKEKRKY